MRGEWGAVLEIFSLRFGGPLLGGAFPGKILAQAPHPAEVIFLGMAVRFVFRFFLGALRSSVR